MSFAKKAFAGVAVIALSSVASASMTAGTDFNIMIFGENSSWSAANDPGAFTVTMNPDGVTFDVVGAASTGDFSLDFDLTFDPDPAVSGNFAVNNNSGSTQPFSVLLSVTSVDAISAPSTILGSTSFTVGDNVNFGGGATLSTNGVDALYQAQVNGSTFRTLFDDPYSLTAPEFLTNNDGDSFGPEAGPSIGIGDDLQILHRFTLTGNDNASFTSTLVLIPSPGAVGLLGLAGAIATVRRRR
ncbi:MAG: hypothetical protein AAFX05_14310 [Planctomycetota bacterium]